MRQTSRSRRRSAHRWLPTVAVLVTAGSLALAACMAEGARSAAPPPAPTPLPAPAPIAAPAPTSAPVAPAPPVKPDRPLASLVDGQGLNSWGVRTSVRDGWLEVQSGHDLPWPSVAVKCPADLSGFGAVAVDVRNTGTEAVQVSLRLDVKGANRTRILPLAPGASGVLAVELDSPAVPGFEPKHLKLIPPGFGGPMTPAAVTGAVIFIDRPAQDFSYAVRNLRALPRQGELFAPVKPFIDRYGQFTQTDWPGKIHSDADFAANATAEEADLAAHAAPADWDAWGGWAAGPKLEASGRFRTAKHDGRWWLVDPDGRLFWSQGVTCVGLLEDTPIDGREDWFDGLDANLAAFPGCRDTFAWMKAGGGYGGKPAKTFAFNQANQLRKHGAGWRAASGELAHRRFRSWGLNTFGNWSDQTACDQRRTVYVMPAHPSAPPIPGCAVPDPWDPRFAEAVHKDLAGKQRQLKDPWCLGVFIGNEMDWGDDANLGRCAAKAPPEQPAKRALLDELKAKHGEIARLNTAWGTAHASWEALLAARDEPKGAGALADLRTFTRTAAARWLGICRDQVHAVDPRALFLGTRMHVWNPALIAAATEACDVMSFNLYRAGVADFAPLQPCPDRPILVTEFHTGANDRGLPRGGLVLMVETQAERAERYAAFVRSALGHRNIVGAHWFQYRDEPATGRKLDGENYAIGFVDVGDAPYPDLVRTARGLGAELYRTRNAGR